MSSGITFNGQFYEFYYDKDLMDYIKKNLKGIKEIPFVSPTSVRNLIRYKDTFVIIQNLEANSVFIKYDKKDKEKVQAIIDLIKKWDYCGAKKGAFCVEYQMPPTKFHLWPIFVEFDSVIIICSGLFEKEHYIKKYTDGKNFKITDL